MRVALLARSAYPLHPPGGLERAVFHLATHLRALGAEVTLFTRPATEEQAFPGEVVTVPYGGHPARHGRILERTRHYPAFALRVGTAVAERVRDGRIDIVDAQGLSALGYGRLRRRDPGLRAPLLMNPQGMEEHRTRGLKRVALARLRRLSREAARLADRVVATDTATRGDVSRLLGVDPARVVVLPNGFDPDSIRSLTPAEPARVVAEAAPALASARPLLLSVGRLEPYKGLLDVMAALDRAGALGLPDGWAWAIVGTGPQLPALARRARRLATPERIHFLGRVSDGLLHALYAAADLFVHATHYEGSSLVTLEAMAHGLAIVATRAGGIPDKIEDAATGRLVEPGDVGRLAQLLSELANDPEERQRLGGAARTRALERFAWPRLAARTLALYAQLVRAARP